MVTAGGFNSTGTTSRSLLLGASIFNLSSWIVSSAGLNVNAGTSTINLSFIVGGFFGGGNHSYHDVSFTGTATVYDDNSFNNVVFNADAIIQGNNIFNSATFLKNATIHNNNTYTNLTFTPGYTYILTTGKTQTVNGVLDVNGNCGAFIAINTNAAGSQSTINHPPGSVTASYVILKDIHVAGGASFTANNSVDLGNNTGWVINVLTNRDLYWIGNTGLWSDGNHWSTSSGGPPSGCIPSPIDNVHFDNNSFSLPNQSVTMNIATGYCNNMSWIGVSNNPEFKGAELDALKIFGSLTLNAAMNWNFQGLVYFEATTAGKTITSAGRSFINGFVFNGVGGSWTLQDDLMMTGVANLIFPIIYLNHGTLNTNSKTVTATAFYSYTFTARTLNMGSSIFNLSGNTPWNVAFGPMTINAGTSVINAIHTVGSSFSGGGHTYYNVNFTGKGIISGNNSFNDVFFASDGDVGGSNVFNNATFSKDGVIRGNNIYTNLIFTAGYNYVLFNNTTQTINGLFTANGNCAARITITSVIVGSHANINHPPGVVTVDYVTLRDINAGGGGSFTANNAIDLGNNTGWIINAITSRDLYWIGNTGNWNDGVHWSLTSGGPPSGCIPTPVDNVHFDINSFSLTGQIVTINVPVAYCNSMSWLGATGNPALAGPLGNRLSIHGSLNFIAAMNLSFSGDVYFEATASGKTITSAGKLFRAVVAFNGAGGSWSLQDDLRVTYALAFTSGELNTNNHTVTASEFLSHTAASRVLNMGSSNFNILGGRWDISTLGMTINAGTSTINLTNSFNQNFLRSSGQTYYNVNFISSAASGIIYGNNNFNDVSFDCDGFIQDNNSFHDVIFHKSGTIRGNNTYNNLSFTPNYIYTLTNGKTQTILNKWNVQGACNDNIIIQSDVAGSLSTVTKANGVVTAFNTHIRDIHAIGGATFNAYNSVNLGGNSGWNFLTLPALSNPGSINGPITACPGETGVTYYISPVPGAISYTWTLPSGATISSGQGDTLITVNFGTAISGNITVRAFSGCEFSEPGILPVTISFTSANAGLDTAICAGSNYVIAGSAAVNYTTLGWTTSGTGSFTGNGSLNPTYIPSAADIAAGQVILTLNATGNGACANNFDDDTMVLTIKPPVSPSVLISAVPAVPVCAGTTITFIATPANGGSAPDYIWYRNGAIVGTNSPAYADNTFVNGDIIHCILISNASCANPDSVVSNNIRPQVNELPVLALGNEVEICAGDTILLNAGPGFISYLWNNASTSSILPVTNPGIYWAQVTDANGCAGSDTIEVKLKPCSLGVFVPNAFTPNNDRRNDVFKPIVYGNLARYHFTVYNRWGQMVFQTNDHTKGWDGRLKGKDQQSNVFVWICQYQLEGEEIKLKKGTVILAK